MRYSLLRRPAISLSGVLLTMTLLIGLAPSITAVETQPSVADSAIEWLRSQQLEDGSFPGFSGEADPSTTADAVMAIAARGVDPATFTTETGNDPVSYLTALASEAAEAPGATSKLLLALHAGQGDVLDPRNVNGIDLFEALQSSFDPDAGTYGPGLFVSAFAILALSAVDEPIEPDAIATLLATQIEDGSWNFNGDMTPGSGDSNTTAIVIQALVATGTGTEQIIAGLDYLRSLQANDGSFAFDSSEQPLVGDANSTAAAVQAHIAAGRDPSTLPNGNAIAALTEFQQESGALTWRQDFPEDNMLATVQSVPALLGKALPISHLGLALLPPDGPDALEQALQPATGLTGEVCLYSIETFHNSCGPFAQYWRANGGLKIFGHPLTEPFMLDGIQVQYFERTRLELHPGMWPENFDILQGRLGAEQLGLGID